MDFGVTKISIKNGDDGNFFTLACRRGTKYVSNSKNLKKSNPTTKTLRMEICLDGTFTISRVFSPPKSVFNYSLTF